MFTLSIPIPLSFSMYFSVSCRYQYTSPLNISLIKNSVFFFFLLREIYIKWNTQIWSIQTTQFLIPGSAITCISNGLKGIEHFSKQQNLVNSKTQDFRVRKKLQSYLTTDWLLLWLSLVSPQFPHCTRLKILVFQTYSDRMCI